MKYFAFEKSIGGVVFIKEKEQIKFLLLQYRSWQWDFPKGHVEKGETELETLKREIFEETGIDEVDIIPNFKVSTIYFYEAKGNEKKERIKNGKGIYIFKKVVFYAVKSENKNVILDFENKNYAWLSFDDAIKKLGNNGSKNILNKVWTKINRSV